jgi:hypothetical protein
MTTEEIERLERFVRSIGVTPEMISGPELYYSITQELSEFELPAVKQFDDVTSLKLRLIFRTRSVGGYHLHRYRASLEYDRQPGKNRSQVFFLNDALITVKEAFNLLEGRSVEKVFFEGGKSYTGWIQLNFYAPDNRGGYRFTKYRTGDSFNLSKALEYYNIVEAQDDGERCEIIRRLKAGDSVLVSFILPSRYQRKFIEANPLYRGIIIRRAVMGNAKTSSNVFPWIAEADNSEDGNADKDEDGEEDNAGDSRIAV